MRLPPRKPAHRRTVRTKPPKPENILKFFREQSGIDSAPVKAKPAKIRKPDGFGPVASKEWDRIIKLLAERHLLSDMYSPLLEIYCYAYEMLVLARTEIKKLKPSQIIMLSKDGKSAQRNHWLSIYNKAEQKVRRYSALLGLLPSDNVRFAIGNTPDSKPRHKNPFDDI